MSAETIYKELLDQFKIDALKAVEEAHAKIQGDLLPYANDDTEHNSLYRAGEMVRSIIQGDFEVDGNKIKVDGWTIDIMTNFDHNKLVDVLAAKAGDKAKDLKIERLERLLADSYSNNW